MKAATLSEAFGSKSRVGVMCLLVAASFILPQIPIVNLITLPLQTFTTTVHEMGHALACLLTGGQVTGMSIVSDGQGHGGLTFCRGGIPFIYAQAGYIMTALVGSAMIWTGHYPRLSKAVLMGIGGMFCLASVTFMFSTILGGQVLAGLGSMLLGLAMGCGIIFVALKLNLYWANILLLFLGIQTGLNALNDDGVLMMQALGFYGPGTWSDASNMQGMTGVPAPIWAGLWTVIAVGLLYQTVRLTYKHSNP